ncbi:MAG: hypothetical protein IPM29_06445 [Planctomycetes bacterium]|nr:hypothetical protein [Planctomycetota bacterium]
MLSILLSGFGFAAAVAPQEPPPAPIALPVFAENRGQWPADVRFSALRSAGALCVGTSSFWTIGRSETGRVSGVRFTFDGIEPVTPIGEARQVGVLHFLLGTDSVGWHRDVATFDRIRFPLPIAGVDVVLRDDRGTLHYDIELEPGAELDRLRIRVTGGAVRVAADGELCIGTPLGDLRQPPPVTYELLPDGGRRPLACRYVADGDDAFRFAVSGRDPARAAVVDPALLWATYLGGSSLDRIVAIERSGSDVYVAGVTRSTNFPTSPTAYDRTFSGTSAYADMFVARLRTTSSGSAQLVFGTYVGSLGVVETPYDLYVESNGNVTIGGVTTGSGIPISSFAFQPTYHNGGGVYREGDGFVLQLSADGSRVNWGTYVGGVGYDEVRGIHLDTAAGRLTVVGCTWSPDFPTSFLAFDRSWNGDFDAFVLRLDATGSTLQHSSYLGGVNEDIGYAVDVLTDGSTILAGSTRSPTFPTTPRVFQPTKRSGVSGFVTRVAADGRSLVASTFLDSLSDTVTGIEIYSLDAETDGSVWVGGKTTTPYFPFMTTAAFDVGFSGNSEGFVSRFVPALSGLTVSSFCGGFGDEEVHGVNWDGADSAVVGGWTTASNFPTTPACYDSTFNGSVDGFALRVSNAGRLLYSSYYGGSGDDRVMDSALGADGSVSLGGWTSSTNLPLANPFDPSANGGDDGFVAVLDARRTRTWPIGYEYSAGGTTVGAPFSAPYRDSSRLLTVMKRNGLPWSQGSSVEAVTFRGVLQIGAVGGAGTLRARLGTTTRWPEQISSRFDDNFASTPRTVFQGSLNLPGYSVRPTVRVPFSNPYLDPGTDNLVLDLFWTTSAPNRTGTDWPISAVSESHGGRAGTSRSIGPGCPGSNGVIPSSGVDLVTTVPGAELLFSTAGSIVPTAGPEQYAGNFIGRSTTNWNGTPLPLGLGFIGLASSCFMRTDVIASQNAFVLSSGATRAYATWQLPQLASWNGITLYSQWIVADLQVTSPMKLIVSDTTGITLGLAPATLMSGQSIWKVGGADGSGTEVGQRSADSLRPVLEFEGAWR